MEIFVETQVYFCDVDKLRQKSLIENINGDFRKWFPSGTDFNNFSQKQIDWVINNVINDKLRPCLKWISAKEIFFAEYINNKYLKINFKL
ncbi:Spiroplasmavirus-related protein [Spiroplasma kunkelii CR2-3x]|uniref:Spiroplasmavirus-related protein n=1 Tax=Spiroplasma kunkelii CR2-3x TaxID=273035 RepID=A0A0K2JIP2_SPIKU|nr:Spiroplasmavirus-related protein [Spiroplasma kunkelii CR2-3x]